MNLFSAPLEFWIAAAVLTAAAVASTIWPYLKPAVREDEEIGAGTRQVLIDQLDELDRDRERSLLSEEEEAGARAEIARRLLTLEREATHNEKPKVRSNPVLYQWFFIIFIPLAGLGLYSLSGVPDLQGKPATERAENSAETPDINTLLTEIEQHLAQNPEDVRGWQTIAPVYVRLGQIEKAEDAYRQILNIGPSDKIELATAQSNLAQILSQKANGVITEEAFSLFMKVQQNNPDDPSGFFFEALALSQTGKRDEAIPAWESLIKRFGKDNPPWLPFARESLTLMTKEAGSSVNAAENKGPSQEDVRAAQNLDPDDRQAFIENMVARLAERLEGNPQDLPGWQRLINAYMVLERKDDAVAALARARAVFSDNEEAQTALNAVAVTHQL